MQTQKGFAAVNGTRIYYETRGAGDPLVLIHGITLDTRMWDDQFHGLAEHYRTVRYDLRGFGKSALPTSESYAHFEDLKALLDYLDIPQVCILGLSRGGRIAIDFALAYPEAVRALIPVDTGLEGYQYKELSLEPIYSKARESGIEAANDLWLNHPIFKPAREKPNVGRRLREMISDYSGWHWVNNDPVYSLALPALHHLEEIRVPTFVVVGEQDLPDFHLIADILARRISNSRKTVIQGVGHMSNMEDPEKFNTIVSDFLYWVSLQAPIDYTPQYRTM